MLFARRDSRCPFFHATAPLQLHDAAGLRPSASAASSSTSHALGPEPFSLSRPLAPASSGGGERGGEMMMNAPLSPRLD